MTYCDRCDRQFNSNYAYNAHRRDSARHWVCLPCDEDFESRAEYHDHMKNSQMHHYCIHCEEDFPDEDELETHNEDRHEYCERCDLWLDTVDDKLEHDKEQHNYCAECERFFSSPSNLRSHLNSSTHRPKNVHCQAGGCSSQFVSKSALLLHLETGTCTSRLTHQDVERNAAEQDPKQLITSPNRRITDTIEEWAIERARDRDDYKCYFCHKPFRHLVSLKQHLASPAHQQPIYRCPGRNCDARFEILSAFCQHAESGSCGVTRFRASQSLIDRIIHRVNRIASH